MRITDRGHLGELQALMARGMSDDIASWRLADDGRWVRHHLGADGLPLKDLQSELIEMHTKRRRKARRR